MSLHLSLSLIESLATDTEQLLEQAVRNWQMVPAAHFVHQPSPQQWSAAQCLDHLNSYGHYYLPKLKKAIEEAAPRPLKKAAYFKPGWLGDYFTKLMLPQPDGQPAKKMKAMKGHLPVPVKETDCHQIIAVFIDQQERLLALLEVAKKVDLNKIRIPISIAPFIKLKAGDTFRFIIAHNLRHAAQAGRALATCKYPVTHLAG